ncbi:isoleucyl-tRNA synthetase [Pancytospora epiphaga]|nr:isoleucyl-tRNA synthetase [Pancytospora epiphaga]
MFTRNSRLSAIEEKILKFWEDTRAFEVSKELSAGRKKYVFYDGPPFATGLPHYGHILSGTIKDIIGRFMYQQGLDVPRRFGWDCHGLPVEYEIDKSLGITRRSQVLDMGIDKYNDECKAIVMKYASAWESIVARMGRWVDFQGGYKTMDLSFMESTWFILSKLYQKGKVYRGYKVMPFSTACKTPLSNFEANQNYKDVSDPSVLISFPLKEKLNGQMLELIVWTTTPWTLPANCALAVNPDYVYCVFEHKKRLCVMHNERLCEYFKDARPVGTLRGSELVGLEYEQPFLFYEKLRSNGFFRVLSADFVTDSSGTAIVHCAPAFGEEDHKTCVAQGLITENGDAPCPIDESGCFTMEPYKGMYVKDLDKVILQDLKDRVLMNARSVHSYPYCWRSDTPLIYRLVPNWFVRVKESRGALLRNNELINWEPQDIKYKRFHNWLEQARDWAIGRNRFWGTPIPIWKAEEGEDDYICVGSIAELERLSGQRVENLHRQYVDNIIIEKNGKKYRRVEEVLDCWFESGAMPYAQEHWPFCEGEEYVTRIGSEQEGYLSKDNFPADFIGEGLDQTRGWFYTLNVLSTLLFDKPAFKNVICFGIILAEDGKKMSKRLKNYPDPQLIFDKHGADALRMYLLNSPVVSAENLRFTEAGVLEMNKVIMIPWYNSLSFYMECADALEDASVKTAHSKMDEWITASFATFCHKVTSTTKTMKLSNIFGYVVKYIDDLSNWYIRINRKGLRANAAVLREQLINFSIVMAPFTPFFSEYCFQSIKSRFVSHDLRESVLRAKSVHHCLYPETDLADHPFEHAKDVIEAIRQMREEMRLKLKRPLKGIRIVSSEEKSEALKTFKDLIKSECNVLSVIYESEEEYKYSISAKPCFEHLKKDIFSMKKKMGVIKTLTTEQLERLLKEKSLRVGQEEKECDNIASRLSEVSLETRDLVLTIDDLLIEKKFVNVDNSAIFGNFGLIFDVTIDQEIVDMTLAREFYSFLQKLRKSVGLVVSDKIYVAVANEYIRTVVTRYYPEVLFGEEGMVVAESEYLHDDDKLKVTLFKAVSE